MIEKMLGHRKYMELPYRLRSHIKDLENIGRLLNAITTFDSIGVFVILHSLINEPKENSMFEYPDEEVSNILFKMISVNTNQVYSIQQKYQPLTSKSPGKISSTPKKLTPIKDEQDRQLESPEPKSPRISKKKLIENFELKINFEYPEKLKALANILEKLRQEQFENYESNDENSEIEGFGDVKFQGKRFKKAESEKNESKEKIKIKGNTNSHPKKSNKVIMICCNNEKEKMEIENFLIGKFNIVEDANISFLVKLKKYLFLKSEQFRTKHGIFSF